MNIKPTHNTSKTRQSTHTIMKPDNYFGTLKIFPTILNTIVNQLSLNSKVSTLLSLILYRENPC